MVLATHLIFKNPLLFRKEEEIKRKRKLKHDLFKLQKVYSKDL